MKALLKMHVNSTGVGTHGQYLLSQIVKEKDIRYTPVNLSKVQYSISREQETSCSEYLMTAPATPPLPSSFDISVTLGCIGDLLKYYASSASVNVGYLVFEAVPYPGSSYEEKLKRVRGLYDHIIVPSKYCADILSSRNIVEDSRLHIVPEGVSPVTLVEREQDNFFTIGSVGKFEKRKGHLNVISALQRLPKYPLKNNKLLLFRAYWHSPWHPYALEEYLIRAGWMKTHSDMYLYPSNSVLFQTVMPFRYQEDLFYDYQRKVDVSFYPVLAEGWGLPILESIAMNKPTVSCALSGNEIYMSRYSSLLGKNMGMRPEHSSYYEYVDSADSMFFTSGLGTFCGPKESYVHSELVNIVYNDDFFSSPSNRPNHLEVCQKITEEFSWKNAKEQLTKLLETLSS